MIPKVLRQFVKDVSQPITNEVREAAKLDRGYLKVPKPKKSEEIIENDEELFEQPVTRSMSAAY